MSHKLSDTVDKILQTDISSHHYGVPKLNHVNYNLSGNPSIGPDGEYTQKYFSFINQLQELSYYHELKNLRATQTYAIENEYEQIIDKLSLSDAEPSQVLKSLQGHEFFKNTVLSEYLLATVPILKSLFHIDSNLTGLEVNISNNLERLFDVKNTGKLGNIMTLILSFEDDGDAMDLAATVRSGGHSLEQIRPILQQLTVESENIKGKINQIKLLINDEVDEVSIRRQFKVIINDWRKIIATSNFLPNFITNLPLNWYEDEECFKIIEFCGDIRQKIELHLQVLNDDNIDDIDIKDILMLEI